MTALDAGKKPRSASRSTATPTAAASPRSTARPMIGVSEVVRAGAGVKGGDTVDVDLELDTAPRDGRRSRPTWRRRSTPSRPRARRSTACPTATSASGSSRSSAPRPTRRASDGSRRRSRPSAKAGRAERLAVRLHAPPVGAIAPSPDHDRSRARPRRQRPAADPPRLGPPGAPDRDFLRDREAWIARHLERRARQRAELAARGGLTDGAAIRFRGELHRLRIAPRAGRRSTVARIVTPDGFELRVALAARDADRIDRVLEALAPRPGPARDRRRRSPITPPRSRCGRWRSACATRAAAGAARPVRVG